MGNVNRVDGTFEATFTVDGELKLRERVKEKLKELIGDSIDDILVDYVIMLLRNGRRKEEARNQLNHILGDDSDSFVCWLWDHLTLNIDLYVQRKEVQDDRSPKRKISEVQAGGDENQQYLNSEPERGRSQKLCRSRRNKGWKGLVRREAEPPTLWSSGVFDNLVKKRGTKVDNNDPRSSSSSPAVRGRNRGHPDKRKTKKDQVSQGTTLAPRRLLQFALRDAVATSRPSFLGPPVEPSLKHLRYVVVLSDGR